MNHALTRSEVVELKQLEDVIARGLETFYAVGCALREIRDQRLYRQGWGSFEDYCRDRWAIGRSHAYRLIQSAGVVETLSPIGDKLPANEGQARPLARLEPEQQRLVWAQLMAETEDDAAVVTARVQELCRQALASLPPEERAAVVMEEEERVLAVDKASRWQVTIDRARRHLAQLLTDLENLHWRSRELARLDFVERRLDRDETI